MLYALLRAISTIALRWYYADVDVVGADRVPRRGPLVVVANHPNALIDALLVGVSLPRRILLTAKATLFESRALAVVLRAVGVVPLRRAKDERAAGAPSAQRNAETFRLVTRALRSGAAVLIFPEGISHDEPSIAPLKSGAARMALQARDEGVTGVRVLQVGLIYEEKERPNSRVLVRIAEPLDLDAWCDTSGHADPSTLTRELDDRLRAVTLNFATQQDAARAIALARALAAIVTSPAPVQEPSHLDRQVDIAVRVDAAINALDAAEPALVARADSIVARLAAIERHLEERGADLSEMRISPRLRPGARFVVREGLLALLAFIVAVAGRLTHWIPIRLGRGLAMRSLGHDQSRDQPAMRTILFCLALVIVWYALAAFVLVRWRGPGLAVLVLATVVAAAQLDRVLQRRIRRAIRRARTYLALRADPTLQARVLTEVDGLLRDALALEQDLGAACGRSAQ